MRSGQNQITTNVPAKRIVRNAELGSFFFWFPIREFAKNDETEPAGEKPWNRV